MDVAGVDTRDVDLLPLNGHIVRLEDLLDRLGDLSTDTVTGNQGNGVLAAELGGLEDVLADGSEGCVLLDMVCKFQVHVAAILCGHGGDVHRAAIEGPAARWAPRRSVCTSR